MSSFNDFFLSETSKKFLNKWINEDFKKKPLCIYGKTGLGKTSLAKCILHQYDTININTDFIKKNIITLPCHPGVTISSVNKIINLINKV